MYAYCGNNPVMYSDISGYAPEWLKTLGTIGAVVGVVIVVAAITVLTMGVGTTLLAGTLAGAVIHGAAVGALYGAAIGAGIGALAGAIGSLIAGEEFGSSEFWSNTVYGAGAGFGIGALIGAISGGVYSYSSFVPSQINGYTSHGINRAISHSNHGVNPKSILNTVKNPLKMIKQTGGRFKFMSKDAVVVLNRSGRVITTYAKSRTGWRYGIALAGYIFNEFD